MISHEKSKVFQQPLQAERTQLLHWKAQTAPYFMSPLHKEEDELD